MDLEVIRSLMFGVLKNERFHQMGDIEAALVKAAEEKGFLTDERRRAEGIREAKSYAGRLAPGESSNIREVIWELIIQGILTPGYNDNNPNLPFLRLTDWGRQCVDAEQVVPYDRDGYLSRLHEKCPDLERLAEDYITEALECFRRGCLRAAPVMLGVASEHIVLRLMDGFHDSIEDQNRKTVYAKRMQDLSIKRRFDYFREQLSKAVSDLPAELRDALDINLEGIFTLLRYARNETGHPTVRDVPREQVFVNFGLFIPYCERVHGLIRWLASHKV